MVQQQQGVLWEAIRSVLEGASENDFLAKAIAAKTRNYDVLTQLTYENRILDNVVARFFPNAYWVNDWWNGKDFLDGMSNGRQYPLVGLERAEAVRQVPRAIAIAMEMVANGQATVTGRAIAEQMIAEGSDNRTLRNLSVSVGNILARTDGWERVKPGEYTPTYDTLPDGQ